MREVAVIGAGFAGLSATHALRAEGVSVRLYSDGVSASEMSSGACDLVPWRQARDRTAERAGPTQSGYPAGAFEFLAQLGFSMRQARVVTYEGILRPADGLSDHVLNLEAVAGGIIGLLDLGRSDWEPARLASELARTAWAERTHTRFVPIELSGVFDRAERALPLAAFCRLLDDEGRAAAWRDALRQLQGAQSTLRGLLCGPWLGTGLSSVQLPVEERTLLVGETLSPPQGPGGARFRLLRERLCRDLATELVSERVLHLSELPDGIVLESVVADEPPLRRSFAAAVVATGGVFAEGLVLRSPLEGEPSAGSAGRIWGSPLDERERVASGALEGQDPDRARGGWLAVGRASGVVASSTASRIQFAGDVCEAQPHLPTGTVGSAVASGKAAAERLFSYLL